MGQTKCRCGFDGNGPHPCHNNGYSCRKPAAQRFYNPTPVALAGVQMKLEMSETWACDECWAGFRKLLDGSKKEGP
jgi:hypothetical protein